MIDIEAAGTDMVPGDRADTKAASRRDALKVAGGAVVAAATIGAATSAQGQTARAATIVLPAPAPIQVPRAELVDVIQYEEQARLKVGQTRIAAVAGSDRTITDRITLRPRINIPTRDLDLTCTLFGDQHFAPIIVGPMADQARFHPDGEMATARGASAARAAMVACGDSGLPLATIAQATRSPLWVQVFAGSPRARAVLARAGAAGAKAVIVTIGAGASAGAAPARATPIDWAAVDAVVKGTPLPVVVKGITRPEEAREAVARGARGVVVSNWRGGRAAGLPGTLLLIEPIVQAVGDRVPVLADGSFRYGSDIVKALGLGARAVLVGRPAMWGLAAYGDDGVRGVVEMLQTDLARIMAMCGRPALASLDRGVVRIHGPLSAERKTDV